MKAVVLGGGSGTRLRPYLASGINKHLVPVYDKPLIHHVLHTLSQAGVRDVLFAFNGDNPGLILKSIGDGSKFGLHVQFIYNTKPMCLGPANHFLDVERWIGYESFLLILGDSLYLEPLVLPEPNSSCVYMWTTRIDHKWDDFRKYAQVTISRDTITRLERSEEMFSPIIQTGAWVFLPNVFEKVRKLFKYKGINEEVRITDVVSTYVQERNVRAIKLGPKAFIDCGTPEAIYKATQRLKFMAYKHATQ